MDTIARMSPNLLPLRSTKASKPTKTRWWILLLISLMYLIAYMDRSNISVAQPEIAKEFGLSKTAMGLVLAAFTWAYALGQVPAGWLGDRFGPRKVLAVIMSWWAIAAAMTGAALGLYSLFSARFLLGLGRSRRLPGGQPWDATLVSQVRTRPHSRHHAFLQPVRCGRHAVRRGRHHARFWVAGHLLHLRFPRHRLGHRVSRSSIEIFRRNTRA